jgi:hypothetical protein
VKRGGHTPPARAGFSIMMECTPEIGHCHSVCTLWAGLCREFRMTDSKGPCSTKQDNAVSVQDSAAHHKIAQDSAVHHKIAQDSAERCRTAKTVQEGTATKVQHGSGKTVQDSAGRCKTLYGPVQPSARQRQIVQGTAGKQRTVHYVELQLLAYYNWLLDPPRNQIQLMFPSTV